MWVTDNLHTRRYFEGRTSSLNGNWVWCAVFKVKLILVTASGVNSSSVVLTVKVVAVAEVGRGQRGIDMVLWDRGSGGISVV